MTKRVVFSLVTGRIFEINEDEIQSLDNNQLLLNSVPNKNCKKCYGRFHVGKNLKNDMYTICPKCTIKYIDFDDMENRLIKKNKKIGE